MVITELITSYPRISILVLAISITFIMSIVTKKVTDQNRMKELKDIQKACNIKLKNAKGDQKELQEAQKQVMECSMELMKHSFKPMLFTFIPIILIFGWMTSHFAYDPIMPGQDFTTTIEFIEGIEGSVLLNTPDKIEIISPPEQEIENNEVTWRLKGEKGSYILEYVYNEKTYKKEVLITEEREYKPIEKSVEDPAKKIRINNDKFVFFEVFGWEMGWLISYIILSIIFSIIWRKALKIV